MSSGVSGSGGSKRTHRIEKLARLYDDEILPIWAQRFGRLIVRGLEIARKMDEQSRMIAIDSSSALLDVARKKADEHPGRQRIFFRTEPVRPRLPFTADVFDIVYSNLGLDEFPNVTKALRDFARVAKPGGRVLATLPLAGSWQEFHDIYREVLVKQDKGTLIERLDRYVAALPDAAVAEGWLHSVGLDGAKVEVEAFTLLFRSAREFFFAPVVEYGPLPQWKAIAGHGQELQDVFWFIKEAIDAYFGGRAFEVTIHAGCLSGVKGPNVVDEPAPRGADPEDLESGEVELVVEDAPEASESFLEHEGPELDAFRDPDES